jgi:hypothetical protein
MNFDETVERAQRILPLRWQRTRRGAPISMAVLQSQKHIYTEDELRGAGERGWGIPFDGASSKMHFAKAKALVSIFKAGPHVINLFYFGSPLVPDPASNDSWLPREDQRRAWREHIAVVSFDYLTPGQAVNVAYAAIAKLLAELAGNECAAIYLPREGALLPNLPMMRGELRELANAYKD